MTKNSGAFSIRDMDTVEMPDMLAESLVMLVRQNQGKLGKKRREDQFGKLTEEEVRAMESIVREEFEGFPET